MDKSNSKKTIAELVGELEEVYNIAVYVLFKDELIRKPGWKESLKLPSNIDTTLSTEPLSLAQLHEALTDVIRAIDNKKTNNGSVRYLNNSSKIAEVRDRVEYAKYFAKKIQELVAAEGKGWDTKFNPIDKQSFNDSFELRMLQAELGMEQANSAAAHVRTSLSSSAATHMGTSSSSSAAAHVGTSSSSSVAALPELLRRMYLLKSNGELTKSEKDILEKLFKGGKKSILWELNNIETNKLTGIPKVNLDIYRGIQKLNDAKNEISYDLLINQVAFMQTLLEHYEMQHTIATVILANKDAILGSGNFAEKKQLLEDTIQSLKTDTDNSASAAYPTAIESAPRNADKDILTNLQEEYSWENIQIAKSMGKIDKSLTDIRAMLTSRAEAIKTRTLEERLKELTRKGGKRTKRRRTHRLKSKRSKKTRRHVRRV
jgi:hypothetical protein